MNNIEIPVWQKPTITIEEAAAYSSIGINKISEMLRKPDCKFVLYVGNKKLVKRQAFIEYITSRYHI